MCGRIHIQHWLRAALSDRDFPLRLFFAVLIAHAASLQRNKAVHGWWPPPAANVTGAGQVNESCCTRHGDPLSMLYEAIQQDWARQEHVEEITVTAPAPVVDNLATYLSVQLGALFTVWAPCVLNPFAAAHPSIWSVGTVFLTCWSMGALACAMIRFTTGNVHAPVTLAIHSGMFLLDSYAVFSAVYPFPTPFLRRYSMWAPLLGKFLGLFLIFELEANVGHKVPFHEHVVSLAALEFVRGVFFPLMCVFFSSDTHHKQD